MYYRYEVKMGNEWEGVFSIADPDWRRYIGRYISTPKWYAKQKDPYAINSRCWFTEYGFQKYHQFIDDMIADYRSFTPNLEIRILQAYSLENLVMKGKVQVIELLSA